MQRQRRECWVQKDSKLPSKLFTFFLSIGTHKFYRMLKHVIAGWFIHFRKCEIQNFNFMWLIQDIYPPKAPTMNNRACLRNLDLRVQSVLYKNWGFVHSGTESYGTSSYVFPTYVSCRRRMAADVTTGGSWPVVSHVPPNSMYWR